MTIDDEAAAAPLLNLIHKLLIKPISAMVRALGKSIKCFHKIERICIPMMSFVQMYSMYVLYTLILSRHCHHHQHRLATAAYTQCKSGRN